MAGGGGTARQGELGDGARAPRGVEEAAGRRPQGRHLRLPRRRHAADALGAAVVGRYVCESREVGAQQALLPASFRADAGRGGRGRGVERDGQLRVSAHDEDGQEADVRVQGMAPLLARQQLLLFQVPVCGRERPERRPPQGLRAAGDLVQRRDGHVAGGPREVDEVFAVEDGWQGLRQVQCKGDGGERASVYGRAHPAAVPGLRAG
mmetsp:Transcript_34026/g.66474  ORF Transcript_34026/g.66474 Transcript_34026/m.66474 type:complete len:207 (+) Transcript_34026:239-859(+)